MPRFPDHAADPAAQHTSASAATVPALATPLVPSPASGEPALSPAQKKFNSQIKRIRTLQATLAEWQSAVDAYRARHAREFLPQLEDYRQVCVALVRRLDDGAALKLAKADRATLETQIFELADGLAQGLQDEALRQDMQAVAARYAPMPEPAPGKATAPSTGTSTDADPASPEDLWQQLEAEMEAARQQAEQAREHHRAQHAQRQKKPSARQQREQALAQQASQSVREVFRKLASALHPDREPDATRRERKTVLMQQANQAYAASDLLALLQLQMEAELIDAERIGQLDDDRLGSYNRVLAEQIKNLQRDLIQAEHTFRLDFGVFEPGTLKPARLNTQLSRQLQQLQAETQHLRQDVQALADPAQLKSWLKAQRAAARERERWDRIEDALFDDLFR
ncbi:MAG: molecular chaperone DnaJ [Comamonas sp.]